MFWHPEQYEQELDELEQPHELQELQQPQELQHPHELQQLEQLLHPEQQLFPLFPLFDEHPHPVDVALAFCEFEHDEQELLFDEHPPVHPQLLFWLELQQAI